MAKRTEQEIMKDWNYSDKPLVSVCCITYNHELYIRDAIEGFLMQETSFPFEVIIHDDASKDHTVDIIREYVARYPRIIKPIFQEKNQYSKGIKISPTFVWPKAKGKYVALCEGDDYWTDQLKLQIQITEMSKYPECDISFHIASMYYVDKSRPNMIFGQVRNKTGIVPLKEVIRGGGGFFATASIVVRKKILEELPRWFYKEAPVGDLFVQLYGAKRGGALYINKNMATYRAMVPGSWSQRNQEERGAFAAASIDNFRKCFDLLKDDFEMENYKDIDYIKSLRLFSCAAVFLTQKEFQKFSTVIMESYSVYPKLSIKQVLLYLARNIPYLPYSYYRFKCFLKNYVSLV
jgi:glycosyltransferase involved in cell wall biosynthesis